MSLLHRKGEAVDGDDKGQTGDDGDYEAQQVGIDKVGLNDIDALAFYVPVKLNKRGNRDDSVQGFTNNGALSVFIFAQGFSPAPVKNQGAKQGGIRVPVQGKDDLLRAADAEAGDQMEDSSLFHADKNGEGGACFIFRALFSKIRYLSRPELFCFGT